MPATAVAPPPCDTPENLRKTRLTRLLACVPSSPCILPRAHPSSGTVEAIHFKSDQTVRLFYVDLYKNKIVPKGAKGLIDFKTAVPERPGNCHGLAFNYI